MGNPIGEQIYKTAYTAISGGITNVSQKSEAGKIKTTKTGIANIVGTGFASGVTFDKVNDGVYIAKKADVLQDNQDNVSMDTIVNNVYNIAQKTGEDPSQILLNHATDLPMDATSVNNTKKLLATYLGGIYNASKNGDVNNITVVGVASPEMESIKDPQSRQLFNQMLAQSRGDAIKSMLQDLITKGQISFQYVDDNGKQQTQTIKLDDVLKEAGINDTQAKAQLQNVVDKISSTGEVLEQRKDISDPSLERGAIVKVSYGSDTQTEEPVNMPVARLALSLVKPVLTPEEKVNWGVGFQRGRFGYEAYMTDFYNMVANELPKVIHNAGAEVSNAVALNPENQLNKAKSIYDTIMNDKGLADFVKGATQPVLTPMDEAKVREIQARTAKDIMQMKLIQSKLSQNAKNVLKSDEFKAYKDVTNARIKDIITVASAYGIKITQSQDSNGLIQLIGIETINPNTLQNAISALSSMKDENLDEYLSMNKNLTPKAKAISKDTITKIIDALIEQARNKLSQEGQGETPKTSGQ